MKSVKTIRTGVVAGIAATLLVGALAVPTASAQIYPQPSGYCVVSLSDPLPPVDAQVTLTITAADAAGNPIVGESGDMSIVQQPGDSAYLAPSAYTTGPDGTADVVLHTGSQPGLIRVTSPCGPAAVMANVNVGQPPGPPSTGTGLDSTDGPAMPLLAGFALMGTAVTGAGLAFARRRTRS